MNINQKKERTDNLSKKTLTNILKNGKIRDVGYVAQLVRARHS